MKTKSTLPKELIEEILLRLPVKCVLRLKCVCKSWLSLISDPEFAKSHFDLAVAPSHRLVVKFNNDLDSNVNFVDIEDDSAVVYNLPNPRPIPIQKLGCSSRVNVEGSCRGFLLLTAASYNSIYFVIWNPSTGLQKRFKKAWSKLPYLCGIGYDSSTDDYVVVLIVTTTTVVDCFSSRTNSWSCTKGTTVLQYTWDGLRHGLFLNGALHWLVYSSDDNDNDCKIIAFDVAERSLSEIPLPRGLEKYLCHLRVMGGCLCLCVKGTGTELPYQMWTMKEYKVQSSWTKSFVFSNIEFLPICFAKNGDIVGQERTAVTRLKGSGTDEGELPEHCTFKPVWVDFRYSLLHYGVHRESLLSLPSDS